MRREIWLMSWREFQEAAEETDIVILPVGVLEAHGPHLPLGTDFIVPQHLAELLASKLNALIAPAVPYGVVHSLLGYPGSISIGKDTLKNLIKDLIKGLASNGLDKVIILNGHGSRDHLDAISEACKETWKEDGVKSVVVNWWIYGEELSKEMFGSVGGHAGTEETAAIIAIDKSLVREEEELSDQVYYTVRGLDPVPAPGSILIYDKEDRAYIPDAETSRKFVQELVSRMAEELKKIIKGWDIQEIGI
ncbi:MAG: hypothetical protein DSO07_10630 [Thermoproteota archaeon]|jgi:creatinine amidohydrolase|uniref:Creatininase family protein n=1 Tax=Candidatus Methanodesulfokora washburnensis TaxID=2478471 RepID=A0A3R9PGN4_9CREN|nr:creatininase family protein [Candidatus Methanodesulfokores washburnensis]RSN75925.1 creatininase family protein [Candidatus Methanodesulfokores washburnensis]RZN62481.1 MAG: creatininase family protein [Candidatus Methanodesulfokores washburnensis]TDA39323.1 MAG: hypothetical protein DSO07_10630 [Candidatus Korarchaeota archaeon]